MTELTGAACDSALSAFYRAIRRSDAAAFARKLVEACRLGTPGRWGWTADDYAEVVDAIAAAEDLELVGVVGTSYGAIRARAVFDRPSLRWLVLNSPAPPAATGAAYSPPVETRFCRRSLGRARGATALPGRSHLPDGPPLRWPRTLSSRDTHAARRVGRRARRARWAHAPSPWSSAPSWRPVSRARSERRRGRSGVCRMAHCCASANTSSRRHARLPRRDLPRVHAVGWRRDRPRRTIPHAVAHALPLPRACAGRHRCGSEGRLHRARGRGLRHSGRLRGEVAEAAPAGASRRGSGGSSRDTRAGASMLSCDRRRRRRLRAHVCVKASRVASLRRGGKSPHRQHRRSRGRRLAEIRRRGRDGEGRGSGRSAGGPRLAGQRREGVHRGAANRGSTADALPGETAGAEAGEADVGLAIRDALATFRGRDRGRGPDRRKRKGSSSRSPRTRRRATPWTVCRFATS